MPNAWPSLVEALVGDHDALGLLERRQGRLRLQVGRQRLRLIIEERGLLARRRDPQVDRDVHVGLGEGVRGAWAKSGSAEVKES